MVLTKQTYNNQDKHKKLKQLNMKKPQFKQSFHYPSWRPELTAELTGDRFPLPVNTGRVDGRVVSTSRVDGPSTRLVETGL